MENKTIISAICPQCGGPLAKADDNGNMKCEYCGTVSLDNRHSFVHTTRNFEAEFNHYLENAEELMSGGEYDIAFNQFKEIAEKFSKDYRGWWGMARAISHNFTETDLSEEGYKELCRYCINALAKAPDDKKEELQIIYKEYSNAVAKTNQDLLRIYERIERNEKLINLSFPASIVVYTIFMFVYSLIYNLINNPELGGADGGITGIVIPAVIFGIAYGIWALVQDSEYAIIGIFFAAVFSAVDWLAASAILGISLGITQCVVMPLVFAVAFVPGFIMTKKARGY